MTENCFRRRQTGSGCVVNELKFLMQLASLSSNEVGNYHSSLTRTGELFVLLYFTKLQLLPDSFNFFIVNWNNPVFGASFSY